MAWRRIEQRHRDEQDPYEILLIDWPTRTAASALKWSREHITAVHWGRDGIGRQAATDCRPASRHTWHDDRPETPDGWHIAEIHDGTGLIILHPDKETPA